MSVLNLVLDTVSALYPVALAAAHGINPVGLMYAGLSGIYASAALTAKDEGHHALSHCYGGSAVLHALLGVAHAFGG